MENAPPPPTTTTTTATLTAIFVSSFFEGYFLPPSLHQMKLGTKKNAVSNPSSSSFEMWSPIHSSVNLVDTKKKKRKVIEKVVSDSDFNSKEEEYLKYLYDVPSNFNEEEKDPIEVFQKGRRYSHYYYKRDASMYTFYLNF